MIQLIVFLGIIQISACAKCDDICGQAAMPLHKRMKREINETYYYDDDYDLNVDGQYDIDDEDTRIVNGYDAGKRPWLVLIHVEGAACGGALVNNKFVVTAAHCFCRGEYPIDCQTRMVDGKPTSHPVYPIFKHVIIYVGVNDFRLDMLQRFPNMEYRGIKVKIKPGWTYSETFSPDLAIVELNRRVEFNVPDLINPICLPLPSLQFNDRPKDAYVGGWGASQFACDTNEHGPNPHTMCKFPFNYQGQVFQRCTRLPTPSATNPICVELFNWAQKRPSLSKRINFDMPESSSFKIYYWNDELKRPAYTTCYSTKASYHGWCGTCAADVEPGQQGYCDKYKSGSETGSEAEMGRPEGDTNWGWCRGTCHDSQVSLAEKLQETKLDILTPEQCEDLGRAMETNGTSELCAGKKSYFPKVLKFKRIKRLKSKSFVFKHIGSSRNFLGFGKSKYKFYIGGTDSCQGDSGGPFYQWFKNQRQEKRAYLIGVVSRGTGCANYNSPGIFTRITQHLEWIRRQIRKGHC